MKQEKPVDIRHQAPGLEGESFMPEDSAFPPSVEIRSDMISRTTHSSSNRAPYMGGKWILKLSRSEVDDAWEEVNDIMDEGVFGSAKVSTRKSSEEFPTYIICVYNDNITDREYIEQMGQLLSPIEAEEMGYKPNILTAFGVNHENYEEFGMDSEYVYTWDED